MRLGFISEQFESGNKGPGVISQPGEDPGGKSYGIYQLSRSTLLAYLKQSSIKFISPPFSEEFDTDWQFMADMYDYEFALDQHLFITKTHFMPAIIYAGGFLGYNTESTRIQEAIFSMSVQHAGVNIILKNAFASSASVDDQLIQLYQSRWLYVKALKLPDRIKIILQRRYTTELRAVRNIVE